MKRRYLGWKYWRYRLKGGETGVIELSSTINSYAEDESFARHFLRKKLGVKRLPPGTQIFPDYPNS